MILLKKNLKFLLLLTILFMADFLVLFGTFEVTSYVRIHHFSTLLPQFQQYSMEKFLWVMLIIMIMLIYEKIYFQRFDFWSDSKRIIKALFFSFVAVLSFVALTKTSLEYSRSFFVLYFALLVVALPLTKRLIKRVLFGFDMFKKRIYIVGNNRQKRELRREFRTNWYFGYKYDNNHFDALIVASQGYRLEELDAILRQYSKTTKDLYVVPYLDTINFAQADIVEYLNIRSCAIHVENKLLAPSNIYTKTVAEFLVSLLLLPIFLVMHIFISAMIVLDSKGLVMFKQQRLGRNKESFECYKYRTMYLDGDDILTHYLQKNPHEIKYYEKYHKYQNDPRVTPIGNFLRKTSLDELPQIINVLQGKMSLIGPRPYMIEEKAKLTDEIDAILCVKPGITGLWQVSGRNELDFEERKRLDVWYIRNWSLWLDAVILIKTIKVVLFKIGAK